LNINDRIENENIKPESNITEQPGINWYLYGGIILGIIIGLTLNWLYSTLHYQIHLGTKYFYHNGELTKVIKDRNGDKKDDMWEFYRDNFRATIKYDDNFDGKVDCWWEDKLIYREYSIYGLLENEYVDTDKNGVFDLKRVYDPLGSVITEIKIKDTTISNF
jgi:hypothetical protein